MNKKTLLGVLFALVAVSASAEIQPMRINFQGKLINPATNNPNASATVNLSFSLYNVASGGSALYTEVQNAVPLTNGVFSVQVGTSAGISRELFIGASVYVGVTVVGDGAGEMLPRQSLAMSAYAYTANQLSDLTEVRMIAGTVYSTFTNAGNFTAPGGISGSSGTFANGVTASSGTFLATGAAQFSVTTSSGINMTAGTLDVTNTSGIRADDNGITLSTLNFVSEAADPANRVGEFYFNTSSNSLKMYDGNKWGWIYAPTPVTEVHTAPSVAATAARANGLIVLTPFYLPGPMTVNHMILQVTTALGATGDFGIYSSTGGLMLNIGSGNLTTVAAVKNIAPVQPPGSRFLPPGQYYAAATWNNAAGVIGGSAMAVGLVPTSGTVTGGGSVLPNTISLISITNTAFLYYFGFTQ
jgi:hypothetical protein